MTSYTEFLRLIATIADAGGAAATDAQTHFGSFVDTGLCQPFIYISHPNENGLSWTYRNYSNHWIVFLPQNKIFAVREHIHIRIIIIPLILFLVYVTNFVEIYRSFSISIFCRMKCSPLVLIKMNAEKKINSVLLLLFV